MVNQPGVTKFPVARERGLNANMLGRWSCELNEAGGRAFRG